MFTPRLVSSKRYSSSLENRMAPSIYPAYSLIVAVVAVLMSVALPPAVHAQVNVQGQWTTPMGQATINPAHVAVLKNGKVLIVAGSGAGAAPPNTFQAALYDPATQTVSAPQSIGWDMFCNEMVVLPDGRVLIVGGYGYTRVAVYDPNTGVFTEVASTKYARWYPSVILTSTGSVLAAGGIDPLGNTSLPVELFDGSNWQTTYGPPVWMPALYPRGHVLGNGKIFYSGWQTTSTIVDENTGQEQLNVATTNYANQRVYGTSVLLPLYPPSYATKVMILGGNSPSTATTELTSDLTQNQTNPTWTFGPSMAHPRIQGNATILPSGKVLVTGGSTNDEDATTAALGGELYDPGANTFSSAGTSTFARLYHSTAILLPDATVLVAGSQPGLANGDSTFEHHLEVYKPAYLFNADGSLATRPTITSAPASISYGTQFQIQTPNAASIGSVVLVRPGSVTHAFNVEQRLVGLSFTAGSGVLTITAPPDNVSTPTGATNPAPPGYYMVFLVNSSGVPSTAQFVQLNRPLTITPASQVDNTSRTATYTVTVSDPAAFGGGCVTFSASGVTGASGSFNPASVCGSGSTTLTMTDTASTPGGAYSLVVTGTSGSLSHSTRAGMIVGDYTLSVSPASRNITAGTNTTYTVTVSPLRGFTGPVTLSLAGCPANATCTFSPNPVPNGSGTSTLTVTTQSTTPGGTSTLTITGALGPLSHSTTATLGITATAILRPTTYSSPNGIYQNPTNAFDNNLATYASPLGGGSISTEIYNGFGSVSGTITAITLKVSSAYTVDFSFFHSVGVAYSTDGGTNWTAVYQVGFGAGGNRGQQTDSVSLPLTTNLSTLQVDGFINGTPPTVNQQLYEIWLEVTYH